MFKSRYFWWGVSLALLPGLSVMPIVWMAGVVVVNVAWQLITGSDSPESAIFWIALPFGILFGPLLQCTLIGAVVHFVCRWENRLAGIEKKPLPAKIGFWLLAEVLYWFSYVWFILAFIPYALAALFGALLHPGFGG